jgi:23S rRNA pseudouridine1911/1915/1917 synthase
MPNNRQEKTVPLELAGQRFDQALAKMFPAHSRSRLKDWLLRGWITIDGQELRPRDAVTGGETVVLDPEDEAETEALPEAMELRIVHEDEHLLVLNKPAGLVVHPGAGNRAGTLMNGLLHHVPALAGIPRAGIVHRLDKDTSGLMLVAKTLEAHTALVRALADREISRTYLAVCSGVLTGGGTMDAPIGRHPVDRLKMSVRDNGKPAVTHFRVIERFVAHTFVEVELETGRTHQIRVHFAHRRNPLVGDPVYGGRLGMPPGADESLREMLRGFRRQALHATRLRLAHPVGGEPLDFQAPPPEDFRALLDALRAHAARNAKP